MSKTGQNLETSLTGCKNSSFRLENNVLTKMIVIQTAICSKFSNYFCCCSWTRCLIVLILQPGAFFVHFQVVWHFRLWITLRILHNHSHPRLGKMAKNLHPLGFLVHLCFCVYFIVVTHFDLQIYTPGVLEFGWRLKYLTFLNLVRIDRSSEIAASENLSQQDGLIRFELHNCDSVVLLLKFHYNF